MGTSANHQPDLYSLTADEVTTALRKNGYSPQHTRTLFNCLYRYPARDFRRELPYSPATFVARTYSDRLPETIGIDRSTVDGTVRMRIKLGDGAKIESVILCEKRRITLCVSSQAGCAQRCVFCQTGRMGLVRQLQAGEIVGQFLLAKNWVAQNITWLQGFTQASELSNIVFMGMGEPLDNLDSLLAAISILTDDCGLGVAFRKIAVSTVGNPRALRRLLAVYPRIRVALSIHAANSSLRSQLVPANRKWPLAESLAVLKQSRNFMVQYTLLQGVNDSLTSAHQLVDLLQGLAVKVNLIVYNPIPDGKFQPTPVVEVKKFQNFLFQHGIRTMIRFSKGQDIGAACGQLYAKTSRDTHF